MVMIAPVTTLERPATDVDLEQITGADEPPDSELEILTSNNLLTDSHKQEQTSFYNRFSDTFLNYGIENPGLLTKYLCWERETFNQYMEHYTKNWLFSDETMAIYLVENFTEYMLEMKQARYLSKDHLNLLNNQMYLTFYEMESKEKEGSNQDSTRIAA